HDPQAFDAVMRSGGTPTPDQIAQVQGLIDQYKAGQLGPAPKQAGVYQPTPKTTAATSPQELMAREAANARQQLIQAVQGQVDALGYYELKKDPRLDNVLRSGAQPQLWEVQQAAEILGIQL